MDEIIFSIIIVNYHGLTYLKQCLSSIREHNDMPLNTEIIVVDNSEDNKDFLWLKENERNILVVKNQNKGFGEANNVGARLAKGRFLLFLNPDTLLIEPIFQQAFDIFKKDGKLAAFGGMLLNEELKYNNSYGLRMPMGFFRTLLCNICVKLQVFIPKVMYTSGADIFIRRNVFDEVGEFDEKIFMYCEEADLLNRVNKAGYKNGYKPKIKIIHLEGKCTSKNFVKTYMNVLDSRKYYCEKYKIDFNKMVRREYRYCMFKKNLLCLLRKEEEARCYKELLERLNNYEGFICN